MVLARRALLALALTACTGVPGQPEADVVLEQPTTAVAEPGTWEALDFTPAGAVGAGAVWTGTEVLVFERPDPQPEDARVVHLDPVTGATREVAIPHGSIAGSIVMQWAWTGEDLLVWSLSSDEDASLRGEGERYDPAAGAWSRFSTRRVEHAAPATPLGVAGTWAGDEMLVWSHGVAFEPRGGAARAIAPSLLASRGRPAVTWTGEHLVVWGGCEPTLCDDDRGGGLVDGAVYDHAADAWTALPTAPLAPRARPMAVSAGSEVLIWGGDVDPARQGAYGAAYDPAAGTWRTLSEAPISERSNAAIAWSGSEMLVWGGATADGTFLDAGAAYDPATDTWRTLPPSPLTGDQPVSAVWAGDAMVVIGGCCAGGGSAVYRPAEAPSAPAEAVPAPSAPAGTPPGARPATPPATMPEPSAPPAAMPETAPPSTVPGPATPPGAIPEAMPSGREDDLRARVGRRAGGARTPQW